MVFLFVAFIGMFVAMLINKHYKSTSKNGKDYALKRAILTVLEFIFLCGCFYFAYQSNFIRSNAIGVFMLGALLCYMLVSSVFCVMLYFKIKKK